jgi:hypothetical protein
VKLAAIKDALDRSGLAAKTAVSVEVGVKPFEMVFDSISAGPRNSEARPALAGFESPEESEDVIVGEIDDDPLPEDGDEIEYDLPGIHRERESDSDSVVDVEIVADDYTDAPAPLTPDTSRSALSVQMSGSLPGPPGSGLMTLEDAVAPSTN